jgi:ligand-binding SRPBCC domain-containing protein
MTNADLVRDPKPRRSRQVSRTHLLERSQVVPLPRADVFAFFADARNLEAITPRFLHFRILPPVPSTLEVGSRIDYRLSLYGVPFRWRTRIAAWEPNFRFVDVQERGPYALWLHTHTFHDVEGGTLVSDQVEYRLPLGALGEVAHPIVVRRTLARVFDHRRDRVAELLGAPPDALRAA